MKLYESIYKRYKLSELNGKYYLLDMDSNKLSYLIPSFVWSLPIRAIEIDSKSFDLLLSDRKKGSSVFSIAVLSIIIGRPATYAINTIFQYFEILSREDFRYVYVCIVLLLLIFLRILNTLFNKNKEKEIFNNVNNMKETYILLNKQTLTKYYQRNRVIASIIVYSSLIVSVCLCILYSFNFIVIFVICFLFFLFLNRNYVFPYGSIFYVKKKGN